MLNKGNNIPKVHKKVRKHDMLFEYILIIILLVFFVYLLLCVFGIVKKDVIEIGTVAAAVIALYALIWQLYSAIKAKRVLVSLNLNVNVEGSYAKISCELKNIGTKSIYPYLTNLYISEGKEKGEKGKKGKKEITQYEFERFTEHQIDRTTGECFDCILSQHCKAQSFQEVDAGIFTLPPVSKEFEDTERFCINLRELSYFSLVHIMPKEMFRQEVIIKFDKAGVYRAFVIYTGKEWDDCICTTSIFKISENNDDNQKES